MNRSVRVPLWLAVIVFIALVFGAVEFVVTRLL